MTPIHRLQVQQVMLLLWQLNYVPPQVVIESDTGPKFAILTYQINFSMDKDKVNRV